MKFITFITKHLVIINKEKFIFEYDGKRYRAGVVAMSTLLFAQKNYPNDSVIIECVKL